jgi:hypothetical protein
MLSAFGIHKTTLTVKCTSEKEHKQLLEVSLVFNNLQGL